MGLPTSRLLLRLLRRSHRSSRLRIASISDKIQFGTAAHSTQISNTNYQILGSKVSCVIPLFAFYQHMALYTTERAETIPAEVSVLQETKSISDSFKKSTKQPKVIFVLGGPGSGKGTQCSKIVERFGFLHLSAGDLLRAEINSGSENGTMIQNMIKEGKIVPSEVTVKLLQRAMNESGNDKFLIDGFPRNEENRAAFEAVTGIEPEFILFFDCPEEVMEQRLLGRNQGRVDDNIETIRKRFKVFVESSLPVIGFYQGKGKVHKVDAGKPKEQVFEDIEPLFIPFEDPLSAFHKVKITAAAEEVVC